MKTTIEIPEALINNAMQVTGSKTKVEAIKKALEYIIQAEKRKKLINYRGKIDLDIDLDVLRDRKDNYGLS